MEKVTKWYKSRNAHEKGFRPGRSKNEKHFHKMERFFSEICELCTEPEAKMWAMRPLRSLRFFLILLIRR